jgi:hypothetical protein
MSYRTPDGASLETVPGFVGGGEGLWKSAPTPGDVFVSRPLSDVSLAYWQEDDAFIADRMFPGIPSRMQAGSIWEWNRSFFMRNEMEARAPNTESAGAKMGLASIPYSLFVYALHHDIEEQRSANEEEPINSDDAAVLLLTQQAKQFREIRIKAAAFKTSLWTGQTDQTGVAGVPAANQFKQWNDAASTPIKNVTDWSTSVKTSVGVRPNVLSMGRRVWDALKTNPDIIDRIKYSSGNSSPTVVTKQAVAALFEVEEILVSDCAQVTSKEGQATTTFDFVIGKELILFYRPRVAAKNMPSAGYTINWTGYMGATSNGARMKRFYIPTIASWRVEIEQAFTQLVASPALGAYASAVVA